MPATFDENVFINCPFDDGYRPILLGLVFTILYLGLNPRLALEDSDSAESRIDRIITLIRESKYGIHDLSRMVADEEGEYYRMNMPFELGVDFGCKKFAGGRWSSKKILILERERFRYQKSLSDLSGSDIKNHQDETDKAIIAVRDWFVPSELGRTISGPAIWDRYNDFQAYLYEETIEQDGHTSIDDVQITEIIDHMRVWVDR